MLVLKFCYKVKDKGGSFHFLSNILICKPTIQYWGTCSRKLRKQACVVSVSRKYPYMYSLHPYRKEWKTQRGRGGVLVELKGPENYTERQGLGVY